jgi:hypothetical protein
MSRYVRSQVCYDCFIPDVQFEPREYQQQTCGGHQVFNPSLPMRSISHQIRRIPNDNASTRKRGEKQPIDTHSPPAVLPNVVTCGADQGPSLYAANRCTCHDQEPVSGLPHTSHSAHGIFGRIAWLFSGLLAWRDVVSGRTAQVATCGYGAAWSSLRCRTGQLRCRWKRRSGLGMRS